ncbi:probable carboxylesterase 16 [Primulina eburnea]|uniref:probable carboxylesterase 16 n=1 Tax=Primulina eburnea TaxID=1245227 RepID=UPI003C6BF10E
MITLANDVFCRRLAKLCDTVVVVGYRLAPGSRYPAAFEDWVKVILNWVGKQANLAEYNRSIVVGRVGSHCLSFGSADERRHIVDGFETSMVVLVPWLAAHGDLSRCVLLGVSCGANIANYVACYSVEAGKLLDPVRVVAQVLRYPFFIGSSPTRSEIKLSINSYQYNKSMSILAWKLFLPEEEFNMVHPDANPLVPAGGVPLKYVPPTLTVVAEHDLMRDRAIAYSEALRKVNVDAPLLYYKDAIHEFATLEALLKPPHPHPPPDS